MGVIVREAILPDERDALIEALREYLNPKTDLARFSWLYENNPHGKATIWTAIDQHTGTLVGSSSVLPRYFYISGARTLGCVFADSWTHPAFRFLGPALSLQRACLNSVTSGQLSFGYDFPQKSMIAVYRRLRIPVADELITFEKLVSLDRLVRKRVRPRFLASTVAQVANALLAVTDFRMRRKSTLDIEFVNGPCGTEFDQLASSNADQFGVQVARTADYLNWRFVKHFHNRYEIVAVRRNGRLSGYMIALDDETCSQFNVMDFLVGSDPHVWFELLTTAIQLCCERKRSVLSLSVLSRDIRSAALIQAGFRERRRIPYIEVFSPGSDRDGCAGRLGRAAFTYGDEAD